MSDIAQIRDNLDELKTDAAREPQVALATTQLVNVGKRLHEEVQMLEDRLCNYLTNDELKEGVLSNAVDDRRPLVNAAAPLVGLAENLDSIVARLSSLRRRFEG